jgi:Mannosyltransferase (PIG-V)
VRRHPLLWLLGWLGGTRLWSYGFMVLGSYFQTPAPHYNWAGQTPDGLWYQHVPNRWLDVFGRWDSMFYVDIATRGYPPPSDGGYHYHAAFFPLVPSLMRGLVELLPGLTPLLAGALLSNVLLFVALATLERLLQLDGSEAEARAAVVALLVFPVSAFFSVVYSESTALALTVIALYAVRTGRPGLGAVAAGLGLWARPTGWVTCVALAIELMSLPSASPGEPVRLRPGWRLAWLAVPALALVGVLALNQATVGDPLGFLHVQAGWGRRTSFPFSSFLDTGRSFDNHLFGLAGLALFALAWRQRERPSLLVLGGLSLLVPLSTGSIQSMPRFVLSNFPLPVALGRYVAAHRALQRAAVALGLALLAVYSFRWGAGLRPN